MMSLAVLFLLPGCAMTGNGEVNMSIRIETYDKQAYPLEAKCTLYSTNTRLEAYTPTEINYTATCTPINVFCVEGDLKGEYGIIPKRPDDFALGAYAVNSAVGFVFDRLVDTLTPIGALLNYSTSIRDNSGETCLIPRKIQIVLE